MSVDCVLRAGRISKLMTFGAPESGTSDNVRIPSIVILGADALLAARPATPIQLAHACMQVGYHTVVPASWGDELIAAASLRALRHHGHLPAIQCSCPHVADRLLSAGTDLRPFLLSLVSPPVALARYLRAVHSPQKLHITYVGQCPGAKDESIDARLTPDDLLGIFADHHVAIEQQPDYFDSVIPPDRRRYRSQPGGLPIAEMLWSADGNGSVAARSLVEIFGDELPVELAQHLLAGKPALIDVAPALGCVCSGAADNVDPLRARARISELEPPRASHPILDETIVAETAVSVPVAARSAIDLVSASTAPVGVVAELSAPNAPAPFGDEESAGIPTLSRREIESVLSDHPMHGSRRYSPARGVARLSSVGLPTARAADGRQLPRTYVARRRSPTRLNRTTPPDAAAPIASTAELPRATDASSLAAQHEPARSAAPTVDSPATNMAEPVAPIASPIEMPPTSVTEPPAARRSAPVRHVDEERDNNSRFAERTVALPVTRQSDGRPREEILPKQAGDRPVMQLLTLGLLISMIVLVSVTVGVLVGRWMTQR
ncbi:MAG TPA: [Fe-Fe] hydrogenase large subunit C-terminal domain-containing protein [Gemmatimonadaceae bacterium]|nr:[Fe-Fe] hydrogenase large subunit C-terminal domain-containing protein [Gemmatimonadaceae bacterium]